MIVYYCDVCWREIPDGDELCPEHADDAVDLDADETIKREMVRHALDLKYSDLLG